MPRQRRRRCARRDIFRTILVPAPIKGPFRIAIRVRDLGLPPRRHLSRSPAGGRRQRLSNSFAPPSLHRRESGILTLTGLADQGLTARHAVLDAATVVMALTEDGATGTAALLHRAGSRTVSHLCDLLDLGPDPEAERDGAAVDALAARLAATGYRTSPTSAAQAARFFKLRGDYSGRLRSLSRHLGAEQSDLRP